MNHSLPVFAGAPNPPSHNNANAKIDALNKALAQHCQRMRQLSIGQLMAQEPRDYLVDEFGELLLDGSRQHLDSATWQDLLAWAACFDLPKRINALLTGEAINTTENRPAWHSALRQANPPKQVAETMQQMRLLSDALQQKTYLGASGQAITDIIHLGIGGSFLGPKLVCEALAGYSHLHPNGLRVHFVSDLDTAELAQLLPQLQPQNTVVIVASKSFTTQETMLNWATVRAWLLADGALANSVSESQILRRHLWTITARPDKALELGCDAAHVFPMWDWVGGRYSVWSAVGLPVVLQIGMQGFEELLAGARSMDEHFQNAPLAHNLPVKLALIGVWNRNFFERASLGIIPYAHDLRHLPMYLQQLEMESNGKRVAVNGQLLGHQTVPVIWGSGGPNGQHAYFQALQQGTQTVPMDFIGSILSYFDNGERHQALLTNLLAQATVFALGNASPDPHKKIHGSVPVTVLLLKQLSPFAIGQLLALYEHKVFAQSVFWGINAFDQWGVEAGKKLAESWHGVLAGKATTENALDSSSARLVEHIRQISQVQN